MKDALLPEVAIEFLVDCLESSPIHLARIKGGAPKCAVIQRKKSDGAPKTREELIAETREWMEAWSSWNQYFTSGQVRSDIEENPPKKEKPTERDIHAVRFLAVDLDPRKIPKDWTGTGSDWVEVERARILPTLTTDLPAGVPGPPSRVLDSGGGYWGIWLLETPFTIDDPDQDIAWAKAHRAHLIELYREHFGNDAAIVDGVANIDRLCRLPGSLNRPDKKKREEKGRSDAPAKWLTEHCSDRRYPIGAFAPPQGGKSKEAAISRVVKFEADSVKRVANLDAELPSTVPPVVKRVIACGEDPENSEPHRFGWSRSEWQWWATCELARQEVEPETIYSILLDPGWGISASVLDKGSGAESYARRQVERAMEEVEDDPLLAEINARHASVIVGGSSRVLRESWDPLFERRTVEYLKKDAFKDFWNTRRVAVPAGNGKIQEMPAGDWWFRHRLRRSYEDVNYAPGKDLPEGVYNLWQGFAVSPAEGDCGLYLAHVRDNICGGVEEHFEYLIRWMAYAVQCPNRPGHVAVVMRGEKGTGKGVFTSHFGALWGRHFVQITNPDHLTKFNSLIEQASVVFLDEATRPKDKKHEAILKGMVTEESVKVERKGIDVVNRQNVLHLILASNDLSVIKATGDERRYFVLDVSSARRQDHAYFEAIDEQMRTGGYEALLKLLLEMDISGFNVRRAPKTAALQDQVDRNLEPMDEWLLTLLLDGRLPNNVTRTVKGSPRAIPRRAWWGPSAEDLEDGLRQHASETVPRLRDESDVALGKFLDDWGVTSPEKGGRRSRAFPPLPELRATWCEKHGPRDWPRDGDWEAVGDEDNEALG